ncbi:MAG TPA: hypothetical protein ENJ00_02170 [Phycisphaerales bacterium]|nr:hypothetical protein [Phycisphaerales bacterium]
MGSTGVDFRSVLDQVRTRAEQAGVFDSVTREGDSLICQAKGSAEPATYRLAMRDDGLRVSLEMEDRWLSESIEAALMNSGDALEELLDDELAELGYEGAEPTYRHFRSEAMRFTFESPIPVEGLEGEAVAERAAQFLLGYEACFRQLGDMNQSDD